ncbi:hypothetical protein KKG63_01715 [Patescibacteria group bacterium]|nr:hypothetical protein [Patescibacteria group bacterium]
MAICLLLHFYQPANQFGDVLKKVAKESYLPLIKLLKNDKRLSITADFPLSLLAQLDHYGFDILLKDIKELVEQGRIELVGSAAYHPLLTKIPGELVLKQVVLNELAQGYYFGSHKDFEGEAGFMVKNLKGFFPPELAVNKEVVTVLDDMGYEWVTCDECALPTDLKKSHTSGKCYSLSNTTIKLIVRDQMLTNILSFKRDLDCKELLQLMQEGSDPKVIALDAETFGHHYQEGIYLLESLIAAAHRQGCEFLTVSQAFEGESCKRIEELIESTWSCRGEEIYPLWERPDQEINQALWALYRTAHDIYRDKLPADDSSQQHSADAVMPVPIWREEVSLSAAHQVLLPLLKLEQSDQFWWSTGEEMGGKVNFSPYMISSVLDYYRKFSQAVGGDTCLADKIAQVARLLTENKI